MKALAPVLPVAWALLVIGALGAGRRGAPVRARFAAPPRAADRASPGAPTALARWAAVMQQPRVRRAAGVMAVVSLAVGAVPIAVLAALVAGAPTVVGRRSGRRRQADIDRRLPELVDVVRLGTVSGLPLRDTLTLGASVLSGPLAVVLRRAVDDLAQGRALAGVVRGLADALGPDGRGVVAVVLAAEADGADSGSALAEVALDLRRARAARAEARARRLPVLMLFPLVLCVLPAFALLSVVPVVMAGVTEALRSA